MNGPLKDTYDPELFLLTNIPKASVAEFFHMSSVREMLRDTIINANGGSKLQHLVNLLSLYRETFRHLRYTGMEMGFQKKKKKTS